MIAALKVYGWHGFRRECPPAPNGDKQTREVCAAPSKAALIRLVGLPKSRLFNLNETGNDEERALALAEPGTVFWRPIDSRGEFIRNQSSMLPSGEEDQTRRGVVVRVRRSRNGSVVSADCGCFGSDRRVHTSAACPRLTKPSMPTATSIKPSPAWTDITSYARDDKQRVPRSFQLLVTPCIRLVVTRYAGYPPDVWCSQCNPLWDTTPLEPRDLPGAQVAAEAALRKTLKEALAGLTP